MCRGRRTRLFCCGEWKALLASANCAWKEVEIPTSEKSSFIIAWNPFPAFRMSLSFLKFQYKTKARE